ncbi:hypothetical protein ACEPAF_7266 [Sanghuangporus sanghuang]
MLTPIDSPRPVAMFDMNTHSHLSMPNMNEQHNDMLGSPQPYFSRDVRRLGSGLAADDPVRCEGDKAVGIGKRRSRFELSNLIGKITGRSRTSMNANNNNSASEGRLSVAVSPPGPPTSESDQHQYGSASGASRMSVASRRAIEEFVDQDPKFVAYRYPSVDQNIALLR